MKSSLLVDELKTTDSPADETSVPQFYIAASASLQERRTRTLKHGDTFAVFDHRGDIGARPGSSEGLYHRDTRILSQLTLLLEEARPLLLSSTTQDDNAVFSADLSNPDLLANGQIALRREQIHLHRLKFIWNGACYERLLVRNFSDRPLHIRVALQFASDFADLFEVRGERREARGTASAERSSDRKISLRYMGLDEIERITTLEFDPAPQTLTTARAAFELTLKPHQVKRIFVRVGIPDADGSHWNGRVFYRGMRAARHALRESSARAASVDSSNSVFNEIARRAVSDLYMLVTDTPQGPYPYAGTPWFSTPFGRDGIITALMTLWADPSIAKGVLKFLAATQATAVEPERDAEPGKILHEMRHGEMANLREVPFGRYYGSVDATPLFVLLLGEYFARTGDLDTVRTLGRTRKRRLHWIDTYGDRDGDGFVEYYRQTKEGLANQGWKDSQDAVFHRDGRYAEGPDRALRSAGLCLWRQAASGDTRRGARPSSACRPPAGAGGGAAPELRGQILVRGTVGVCAGAGRRQAAVPRGVLELRTGAADRHRRRGSGRSASPRPCSETPASAVGASAPWVCRNRTTTPCPITMARCGRMTTD